MLPSHAGRRCNRRRRLQLLMLLLLLLPSNGILLLLFLQTPKCPLRTPHLPLLRQARRPCLLRVPGARHALLRVLLCSWHSFYYIETATRMHLNASQLPRCHARQWTLGACL